jgi:spore coat polysaccharide biosynthesis protein SpsF (cytidylyltransferase family)
MNSIENAIFIVARLSSKRVPNKNIIDIDGIPMISRLHSRLAKSKLANKIIICTSSDSTDDILEDYCTQNNMLVGRGSLNNVMERICDVADTFNVENIVEVLGDNPFIDSDIVDAAINLFNTKKFDYVANYSNDYNHNLLLNKFPTGIRVQMYSRTSAKRYINKELNFLSHPSSFLYANPNIFSIKLFGAEKEFVNLSGNENLNISVNYPQNLSFAEYIFKKFGNNVLISDILQELKLKPHLLKLISQKDE